VEENHERRAGRPVEAVEDELVAVGRREKLAPERHEEARAREPAPEGLDVPLPERDGGAERGERLFVRHERARRRGRV
jgi:hypothetical protein